MREQILHQIQGGGVEPLQIVKEKRKRMLAREHADEPAEDQLETARRILRRKLGNRRPLSDDELQLRDEIAHQLTIRTQRLTNRIAPAGQLVVMSGEDGANQALEGLR